MKKITIAPKPAGSSHPQSADDWVINRHLNAPIEPTKRLTIDVPVTLHRRMKTQCAIHELVMAEVIREMLERRFPETRLAELAGTAPSESVSS